ncbi:hypothetical protein EVAR_93663_1 [Eumeta japonica]|uniref:Uncharacterized protein n=1 Tax=Eumeta variegata TaxID=151549 RepID=A0A4C1TQP9_EUMVA|nr:hypothetical protein EVAR_93663_1 [Eumeta japonica]
MATDSRPRGRPDPIVAGARRPMDTNWGQPLRRRRTPRRGRLRSTDRKQNAAAALTLPGPEGGLSVGKTELTSSQLSSSSRHLGSLARDRLRYHNITFTPAVDGL